MAFTKYLAAGLSLANSAYAASCSSSSTMTIQSGGDASAIGACSTFSGSITVATNAAGDGGTIDFGNVQSITGDLTYGGDDNVKTISANSLESLGGLNLTALTALSSLNFGSLQQVGDMTLQSLAALSSFNFGTGIGKAGVVTIIDTQVTDISGISQASQIDGLVISDNTYLSNVSFNLKEVGSADIGPNNLVQGLNLNFPNLATADTLTFRNATSIQTPSLMNVTGTLGLYGNKMTGYTSPNLTWAGAIVVNDNAQLTNLSFPKLATINSTANATLQIANNTKLDTVDGFPALEGVSGNVDLSGSMSHIQFQKISNIAGALVIDTSSNDFDCGPFDDLKNSQVVKGKETCETGDSTPTTGGDGGSSTGSTGSESSSGVAVPLDIPSFATGAGVLGAFFALLL